MTRTYWETVQYIGRGYVLQHLMTDGGGPYVEYYDENREEWHEYAWQNKNITDTRRRERIVHVSDTDVEVEPTDSDLEEVR